MMVRLKCMAASAPLKQKSFLNKNIYQIHLYVQFMVASAFLRNVASIEEWLQVLYLTSFKLAADILNGWIF